MPWVFLGLAVGCIAVAMTTQSIGLALVALILALGFMLLGALGIVSARIQGGSRTTASMMSGDALATMRKVREAAGPSNEKSAVAETEGGGEARTDADAGIERDGDAAPIDMTDDPREPAR